MASPSPVQQPRVRPLPKHGAGLGHALMLAVSVDQQRAYRAEARAVVRQKERIRFIPVGHATTTSPALANIPFRLQIGPVGSTTDSFEIFEARCRENQRKLDRIKTSIKRTKKQIRQLRGTNVLFKTDGDNVKKYFLPNA